MKIGEVDWGVLRGSIIFFCVVVAGSCSLFYAGTHFTELAVNDLRQVKSKLFQVRGEYQTIDDEKRIIETYLPQYRALEERGIVGDERRLSWVESLRDSALKIKLPSLRYELLPQQLYQPEFPLPQGIYRVYVSEMTLDGALLHEGDLFALLRELNRSASGLFTVSSCHLSGPPGGIKLHPKAKIVGARRGLRWYTIEKTKDDSA